MSVQKEAWVRELSNKVGAQGWTRESIREALQKEVLEALQQEIEETTSRLLEFSRRPDDKPQFQKIWADFSEWVEQLQYSSFEEMGNDPW